jgi:hypothetical protein
MCHLTGLERAIDGTADSPAATGEDGDAPVEQPAFALTRGVGMERDGPTMVVCVCDDAITLDAMPVVASAEIMTFIHVHAAHGALRLAVAMLE